MRSDDAPRVLRTAPLVQETPEGLTWLRIGSLAAGGEPVYERDATLERLAKASERPMRDEIITGDARDIAKDLSPGSLDCIFTDPVYQNIDDYRSLLAALSGLPWAAVPVLVLGQSLAKIAGGFVWSLILGWRKDRGATHVF